MANHTAWGIANIEVEEIYSPLRLQGQYFDYESCFNYNRYRYYDASVGQFICLDPIGLEGGENPYVYGLSATSWADPLGLDEFYALLARRDGWYPVMEWGKKDPVGYWYLSKGEVWKFGETRNPKTRYSSAWLKKNDLEYFAIHRGTSKDFNRAVERLRISGFLRWKGFLPPGNKCRH